MDSEKVLFSYYIYLICFRLFSKLSIYVTVTLIQKFTVSFLVTITPFQLVSSNLFFFCSMQYSIKLSFQKILISFISLMILRLLYLSPSCSKFCIQLLGFSDICFINIFWKLFMKHDMMLALQSSAKISCFHVFPNLVYSSSHPYIPSTLPPVPSEVGLSP